MVDTNDKKTVATINIGGHPSGVVKIPDGRYLYVAEYYSRRSWTSTQVNKISVIDISRASVIGAIDAPSLTISPDGGHIYVSSFSDGTISVIETATRTVSNTVKVGENPGPLAISPNGRRLNVGSGLSDELGRISVIDLG